MRLRIVLGVTLLVVLVGVSGCAGKTIVLDDPGAGATNDADDPEGEGASGTQDPPSDTPDPSETSPEAESAAPDDQSGWWPPAPAPTATPSGEGEEEPSEPESSGSGGDQEPSDDETQGEDAPGTAPFTFPGWEERIYESKYVNPPRKFDDRDKKYGSEFEHCGYFASEDGSELIGEQTADCLAQGRSNDGKEAAIAVQVPGGVHVWFVRVGPNVFEYFIDESPAGGEWLYQSCTYEGKHSLLDPNCEEPTPVKEANEDDDEDEEGSESESPTESPDETPSETPDGSPSSPSTSDPTSTPSEEPAES